jgi:hypothetical protein
LYGLRVENGRAECIRLYQPLPPFFAQPELSTLVLYDGPQPWTDGLLNRSQPSWPNESRRITEHWAAYIDDKNSGVKAYVPIADRLSGAPSLAIADQPIPHAHGVESLAEALGQESERPG